MNRHELPRQSLELKGTGTGKHGVGDLENVLHIWHPVNNRTIDDLAKLPDLPGEKATT